MIAVLALTISRPAVSGAAAKTPVGAYQGKTSPVWFNMGTHGVHQTTVMNLYVVRASFSSCGGPATSRVSVLCLTSGQVDGNGDVANLANAAPWSTTPYVTCGSVNSVWQPAYRIPASGRISERYTIMTDPGTPNASPVEKVSATIQVLASGSITGSVHFQVYVSAPATGGKWEPYCSSGNVSFRLHRL
jgi:hypothetical protein